MTCTIRCGNCDYWLGESAVKLVFVEDVPKGDTVRGLVIQPPRDVRLCKGCGRLNVFIARRDLDSRRAMAQSVE